MSDGRSLQQEILASRSARALLYTNAEGQVLAFFGNADLEMEPRDLAEDIDLAVAAIHAFGRSRGHGAIQTAILTYAGAVVAVGRDRLGQNVAMISDTDVMPGILLSQLRRLLADDQVAR